MPVYGQTFIVYLLFILQPSDRVVQLIEEASQHEKMQVENSLNDEHEEEVHNLEQQTQSHTENKYVQTKPDNEVKGLRWPTSIAQLIIVDD